LHVIFASSHFYFLGRQLGIAPAMQSLHESIRERVGILPAVRTMLRLQGLEDVQVRLDTGATCIAKTRSRAFHDAIQSDCDVWVSIDDDVEATAPTLAALLEAARTAGGICLAPYVLRQGAANTVQRLSIDLHSCDFAHPRRLPGGGQVVRGLGGGFGLVAITRHAMLEIAAHNSAELWNDTDGVQKLAIFREQLENQLWWGEDLSFFRRVPSHVPIEVLVTGYTMHDGVGLELETLAGGNKDVSS
jgi:hypothetical protein